MTTIKFNDIDISKFKVTKPRDGAKMKTFFIDYDNELFTVQTPKFLLENCVTNVTNVTSNQLSQKLFIQNLIFVIEFLYRNSC